jgi:hypothetical protein
MKLARPRIRIDEGLATIRSENGGQKPSWFFFFFFFFFAPRCRGSGLPKPVKIPRV